MWKEYRKKNTQTMRPYVYAENMDGISVAAGDTPEEGGMIAMDMSNTLDKWYVSKTFFKKNYEEA